MVVFEWMNLMPLENYVPRVAVLDANNNNKSPSLLFTSINIMIQNVKAYSLIGVEHCPFLCPFWSGHIFYRLVFFLAFFQRYFHWRQSFEAVSAQHLTIEQSNKAITINNIFMFVLPILSISKLRTFACTKFVSTE